MPQTELYQTWCHKLNFYKLMSQTELYRKFIIAYIKNADTSNISSAQVAKKASCSY